GGENLLMRYYKPNGYLYLALNKDYSNYLNAGGLYDKSVLIALRCAEGACAWRVGGSGGWKNASVGAISAVNPLLLVGADPRHYADSVGNTAALFWVYGDALTDQEISANFQYAGAALAARGHT